MSLPVRPVALAAALCLTFTTFAAEPSAAASGAAAIGPVPIEVEVRTEDVQRFYRLYEATDGKPTVEQIQAQYLQPGTRALHKFAEGRIGSADKLAAAIAERQEIFDDAKRCAAVLPKVTRRVEDALANMARVYPLAAFPPVTMVIGRGKTGGTTTSSGVVIGVETICSANWLQTDLADRLVHLITHEYAHVQQAYNQQPDDVSADWTVLHHSLVEGGAEFVGELVSGQVSNIHLHEWAQGRECEIYREFAGDVDSTDRSRWLYNGRGDEQWKGDLGYWVGYQIAQAYYEHAEDKQQAVADILRTTPETSTDLYQASGWAPCGDLPRQVEIPRSGADTFAPKTRG